jgi:putative hydrolase of the HAD superfamily
MKQGIFFDLMGVLLFPKEGYSPEKIVDAVDAQIGSVTDDHLFRQETMRQYGLTDTEFEDLLTRIINKYVPFAPLWGFLPELRKRFRLGIINNGTFLTYPLLDARFEMGRNFDLFISSAKEGICKPEAEIYQRACQKLGLSPHQCLFMDDSEENIIGARIIGMQALHWSDRESGLQAFVEWLRNKA